MAEASSISFWRSVRYGLGVVRVSIAFRLARWGIDSFGIFNRTGGRLGRA